MTTLPQHYTGSEDYAAVCYAEADAQPIAPILGGMQDRGFRIWHGADQPLETIAEHLTQCRCIIIFISNAGLQDQSLRREINFSIELNKNLLIVYLEDVNLSAGMRLQLGTIQAMFRQRHATLDAFLDELLKARILKGCFTPKNPAIPDENKADLTGTVPDGLTAEEYYKGGIQETFPSILTLRQNGSGLRLCEVIRMPCAGLLSTTAKNWRYLKIHPRTAHIGC